MIRALSKLSGAAVVFAILLASACARRSAEEQRPLESARPGAGGVVTTTGASASECPMGLPGASTTVTDVDRGVALTITAPADQLGTLRARAERMAESARAMGAMGSCSCPMMGDGGMMGGMMSHGADAGVRMPGMGGGMHGMMAMPPSDMRVDDVDGGVRITLTARDPKDVAGLREHARMHTEHMKSGDSP